MTGVNGEFAITLPGAGRYLLSAKRIGVARYSTPVFEVRTGEARRFDITLEQLGMRLPDVAVTATNLCLPKQDQLKTFVSLWDEARTALIASELTVEDSRVSGWLSQYQRSLDPSSLRILQDQRSVAEGLYDRPTRSISGDSLAKVGYWRKQDADTMVFYGPDAEALLSDAFQSGHCFEVVQGRGDRRGLMGLAFRPRQNQAMGGINGTIWLDGSNFELRYVEFRYTNLITIPRSPHLGGEVHFLRHDTGGWFVRRWYIRMPLFPTVRPAIGGAGFARRAPLPSLYRIIEQGGGLFTPQLRTWERPGFIDGVVMDSTGRHPLRETLVSLSGTPYSTEVDAQGRFRFDSIPPGAYTLLASQRDYADLGQLAASDPLNVVAGGTYRSRMRAATTTDLLSILCDGRTVDLTRATVRLVAIHTDSGTAVRNMAIALRWLNPMPADTADPNWVLKINRNLQKLEGSENQLTGIQSITDESGAATFCGVPAGESLEVLVLRSDDNPEVAAGQRHVRITSFILRAGEIAGRTITVRPPQ